jgi:GT2 family glycosyltransferase
MGNASRRPVEGPQADEATLSRSADRSLLLQWGADVASLPFDLFQRYSEVAKLLDRMLAGVATPVRILEVGGPDGNVLRRLFEPRLVQITRGAGQPCGDDPDFLLLPQDQPLPVADESFDAVVALDVLAQLPAERRRPFLADCLRVARHGAIFTSPHGAPEVCEAESLAAAAYQQRQGQPHPVLSRHQEVGLPTSAEIQAVLRDLDCPHAVHDNAPVDAWLAMFLLSENLQERQALTEVQDLLSRPFLKGLLAGGAVPYRKIYVCAKSFDATQVLEPAPDAAWTASRSAALPAAVAPLHYMSVAAAEALCALADANRMFQAEVEGLRTESREWRQQHLVNNSFVLALWQSRVWKMLRPLRLARRLLRPRGFGTAALLPWHELEPDREAPPGTWIATGANPFFIVPCQLPAGRLHLRLRMTSEVQGRLQVYGVGGNGIADLQCLKQADVGSVLDVEEILELRRPVLGIRLDPLNGPGRFHLESFQVLPVPPTAALVQSWRSKLASFRPVAKLLGPRDDSRKQAAVPERNGQHRVDLAPTPAGRTSAGARLGNSLDIVYVLKNAGICGGVKVVMEHASRLRARGHNVCVYYLGGSGEWFGRLVPMIQFDNEELLKAALLGFRGIKVATWHETASWVADSLRPGDRGYYLIQDIEDSYCSGPEETARALQTYRLGLKPITEGIWVRDQLKERFGLDSVYVSIGLDFDVFQPRPLQREPHRILAQARTWSGGGPMGAQLKGWDTMRNTVLRCWQLNPRTSLTTFSVEERRDFPKGLPHLHLQIPSDDLLVQQYCKAGLYLLTSAHEGFGLTAAEAMACGCPVVATYAQGNEEYCIDGYTALMAPAGDVEQLAQRCVSLQNDPAFAAELGKNGRRFILEYTWDRVIDRLESEFQQRARPEIILQRPEPPPANDHLADGAYPNLHLPAKAALDWSLVIPTVNDVQRVVACVSSCREFLGPQTSMEFIVVDDGTQDAGLVEDLRKAADDLDFQLHFNHQNLGFSATVNHGMRHARGRFLVLCNNDILFFQPWLEALEKAFDADPELGIVGAKLLYPNGSIQHAGVDKVPGQLRWHHAFCRLPGDHPRANRSRYVWSVTGALFAMRRETVRELGGFSTAYATAYEDLDYCLHAWSNGTRVGYCAEVAAYHLEGGTRGATPGQKLARPLLWTERERAGGFYFDKKWAALCHQESFEALFSRSRRPSRRNPTLGRASDAHSAMI